MTKLGPILALVLSSTTAFAGTTCPAAATDAAKKQFPDATVTKCVAEGSNFEVKLTKKDGARVEVEVTATGELVAIEEVVPASTLPPAVAKAFAAKYPKASPQKVEKITKPKAATEFEIAFTVGKQRKEATFDESGTFVEEE